MSVDAAKERAGTVSEEERLAAHLRREHEQMRAKPERRERRRKLAEQHGSEEAAEAAIFVDTPREAALRRAVESHVVRGKTTGWEMGSLSGWDGGRDMPAHVRAAIEGAYPFPASVSSAWVEHREWDQLHHDRDAFDPRHASPVWDRAWEHVLGIALDTIPAASLDDIVARLDWMEHLHRRGFSRDVHDDLTWHATLRADVAGWRKGPHSLRTLRASGMDRPKGRQIVPILRPKATRMAQVPSDMIGPLLRPASILDVSPPRVGVPSSCPSWTARKPLASPIARSRAGPAYRRPQSGNCGGPRDDVGPFLFDLGPAERKARLRCLRLAVKIFTGPRGEACRYALLRAEISGEDPEMLAEAVAAFGQVGSKPSRRGSRRWKEPGGSSDLRNGCRARKPHPRARLTALEGAGKYDTVSYSAPIQPAAPASDKDWPARAAVITVSTGEGRERRLTTEGAALFEEMVRAGVRNPEIACVLGMAKQSVHARAKKVLAAPSAGRGPR